MKTISMTAWRRPEYEAQVLQSLEAQITDSGYQFMGITRDGFADKNLGCNANTFKAIQGAFDAGSDYNLHIEDDTVLAPDALKLCDWFYNLSHRDDYTLLNLHAASTDQSNPLSIVEFPRFNSWGWAITRSSWEAWFKHDWNRKVYHPNGWDWSMGLIIQRQKLKSLRPELSRVRNIGRDKGTYETPGHWDTWAPQLSLSEGTYGTDFQITYRIDEFPPLDQWVHDEAAGRNAR